MRIIQSQAREALRLHEKSIEALHAQRHMVEAFLDEDDRRSLMRSACDLEARGIPVLDKISSAQNLQEIESIMSDAKQKIAGKSLQTSMERTKVQDEGLSDIFEDGLDDSIFREGDDT
jgi:hypothetical protein